MHNEDQLSRSEMLQRCIIHSAPINEFDFDAVAHVMKKLNWTWGVVGAIPTAEDLRQTVAELQPKLGKQSQRPDQSVYVIDNISSGGIGVALRQDKVIVTFECATSSGKTRFRDRATRAFADWQSLQRKKKSSRLSR